MASAFSSQEPSHHDDRHVWLADKRSCDVVVCLLQKKPGCMRRIASSPNSAPSSPSLWKRRSAPDRHLCCHPSPSSSSSSPPPPPPPSENREDDLVAKKQKQKSELASRKRSAAAAEDGHSSEDGEEDDDGSSQERKRIAADVRIHLHAPSDLLARNLYFASRFREPWCEQYQQHHNGLPLQLTIETEVTTLLAYQRCIELLCSPQTCSPYSFKCPTDALDILLAADHLLFQECSSACMEYLAAAPWSRHEEAAIRRTFFTVSLKLSSDLVARLGFPYEKNLEAFKSMLHSLYLYDDRLYGSESAPPIPRLPEYDYEAYEDFTPTHEEFEEFVRAYLADEASPPPLQEIIRTVLHEIWAKQSQDLKVNHRLYNEEAFCIWIHSTEFVLETDDAKLLVQAFACDTDFQGFFSREFMLFFLQVHNSEPLVKRLFNVLMLVFQRVAQARVILPAEARLSLLKAWLPRMREMINRNFYDPQAKISAEKAVIQIMKTLPMDHKLMLECMAIGYIESKSNANFSLREALYTWGDRLQAAMDGQGLNNFNKNRHHPVQ